MIDDRRADGGSALPVPGAREVRVWCCFAGAATRGLGADWLALLDGEERRRLASFGDARRRDEYLAARALCRWALSQQAPVAPGDWRFRAAADGRLHIAAPALAVPLWFSLAHADGVSVCATTRIGAHIGVDVERVQSGAAQLDIARQFFPAEEALALAALPPAAQAEAFCRLWTLKESFVKAAGIGLEAGLSGTCFDLRDPSAIRVRLDADLQRLADPGGGAATPAGRWQFASLRLPGDHLLAVAVLGPDRRRCPVRVIHCIPTSGRWSLPPERPPPHRP